jgi:hypothetical protein
MYLTGGLGGWIPHAPPMDDKKYTLSFEVEQDLLNWLRKEAAKNFRSVAAQARLILTENRTEKERADK